MKNPKTAVIVVSKFNLDLAVLVLKKIENCQIHGLNIIDAKLDVSFKNLAKHIQLLQKEKTNIIAICSIPIIIRSLEGKLPKKHNGFLNIPLIWRSAGPASRRSQPAQPARPPKK